MFLRNGWTYSDGIAAAERVEPTNSRREIFERIFMIHFLNERFAFAAK